MKTRSFAFIFVALVLSLPLAVAVLAHSDPPVVVQASESVASLTGVASEAPDNTACDASASHMVGECVPTTCQISCPLDSCNAGPCDEGLFAKCVCRPGGHALCGCAPCQ